MEAPKKIYFTTNEHGTHYYTEGIPFEREYIEFIRFDVFIKKLVSIYLKLLQIIANLIQLRLMNILKIS